MKLLNVLNDIKSCKVCESELSHGVNPVLSVSRKSKILIIGQAPGLLVHQSGKPWDDKSGERLREWLGVTKDEFYDPNLFGILPMGFCYPGKGKSGDLPPRKECAPLWHQSVLDELPNVEFSLLIGQYAQNYYLNIGKSTLTERVRNFENFLPRFFPLPHPSPRNNIWLKRNTWFGEAVLPSLKMIVRNIF